MIIYMYIGPGWGPLGFKLFSELLIFSHFVHFLQQFPFKKHFTIFPIPCMDDLCRTCCKIAQCQPRVIIYTTQTLISIKSLFLITGHIGNLTHEILLQIYSSTITVQIFHPFFALPASPSRRLAGTMETP